MLHHYKNGIWLAINVNDGRQTHASESDMEKGVQRGDSPTLQDTK